MAFADQLKTAEDIAKQVDAAMSLLNSCIVAATDLGFIKDPNGILPGEDELAHTLHFAWSKAYDAWRILERIR